MTPAGATGTAGAASQQPRGSRQEQPKVSTEAQTRFEVTTLTVQSVTPTGDSCAAAPGR